MGRIAFWLVGIGYFLSVALLPNVLLGWWYLTGVQTHARTVPLVIVLLVGLWASRKALPPLPA